MTSPRIVQTFLALAVLGAVLYPAREARADKNSPKVRETKPDEGPAGAMVHCDGVNFPDKAEDCDVTIDNVKCYVTESRAERVSFIIPGMGVDKGAHTVTIRVKGGESCTTKFKVIAFKDKKEEDEWHDQQRQKYEGVGLYVDPFKQIEAFLKIEKFEITAGDNPAVIIHGQTTIPQGLSIGVIFGFANDGEKQIDARKLQIHGEEVNGSRSWKAIFGPYTGKQILAGRYFCLATFEMAKQSALDLKRVGWPDKLDEGQRKVYANVWKREFREYGTKEDMAKEEAEIRAHYVDLCRKTTDALDLLEKANCAAGKSYHRKASGSGYDEDAWTKWVGERGIAFTEDDLKKLKADTRFINKGGALDREKWEEWIDKDHFAKLGELSKRHQALKDRWVGAKEEHLPIEGDSLIAIIVKMTQIYSTELYAKAKIELPESLRSPKEFSGGFEATSASRQTFENQRHVLLQRLQASMPAEAAPGGPQVPRPPKAPAPQASSAPAPATPAPAPATPAPATPPAGPATPAPAPATPAPAPATPAPQAAPSPAAPAPAGTGK